MSTAFRRLLVAAQPADGLLKQELKARARSAPFRLNGGATSEEAGLRTMIEIVNRQRKIKLDLEAWQAFAQKALKTVPAEGAGITIAFVSDRAMRELNRMWRHKKGTTDVLSFPADQDQFEKLEGFRLGDVAISVEQAARQAEENGLTLENELQQLILHGMLHLCGYDHETDQGEMNKLELRLRRRLGI